MNVVKMQVVTKQIRGVSYKPTDLHDSLNSSSVILLRANNIDDGKINFDDVVYVDKSKVSKDQYLKKGDILICASSGSKQLVGKAASFDFDKECTFGAFCKVVRPDENVADYIGKYFQSVKYRSIISNVAIGANINNIRNEHIDSLELPMYSTEKANDIVHLLSKVQSIIEYRKQELSNLDDLIKARFVELFGHPDNNEKGWKMNTFGDICTVRQGLQIPISKRLTEYEEDCYEYITVQYLHGGKAREYIKNPKPTVICTKDDILMTRTGNTGMIVTGVDGVFHNNFFLIDFDRSKYDKEFLVQYLNLDIIQADILRRAGTSTIPDLNHGEFYKIKVFEPPIVLQREFNRFLEQVDKSKVAVQKALDKTQLLFDSLMQKYFG